MATPVLLLVHVPPLGVDANVVVCVPQNTPTPVIADGCGFTINGEEVIHVDGAVYVILAVPADTLTTAPLDEPIVATAVLSLNHVPPVGVDPKVELVPLHTVSVPVIGVGAAL